MPTDDGASRKTPAVPTAAPQPKTRLLTAMRAKLRLGHYSLRTEQAYIGWVVRFVRFHRLRHPAVLGEEDVLEFLHNLAKDHQVAASTQEQALCALLFLYKHVLDRPLRLAGRIARGRAPTRVPHVLSRSEVSRVLSQLTGVYRLVGTLLYGSGLRLLECLTLRVKDLDLARGELRVRRGKGGKDRVTVIPAIMAGPLRDHLDRVRRLHLRDLSVGAGRVALPMP